MRVLWFTNIPMQPLLKYWGKEATGTGFWMHAQLPLLQQQPEISHLGVVYAGITEAELQVELDGVDYFVVPLSRWSQLTGVGKKREEARALQDFTRIIERFQPDLLHIHGTERFYGRLKTEGRTKVPTLLSLQGVLQSIAHYAWGDRTFFQMVPLVNGWEIQRCFPTLRSKRNLLKSALVEEQMIQAVDGLLGRTAFDRSFSRVLAPKTPYFHEDRLLRPEFYGPVWHRAGAARHRVYTSGRLTFAKGMHVFLAAMAMVKKEYPDVQCRIAGQVTAGPESAYMQRLVHQLGLTENVIFLHWLPASKIVEELMQAHCYVNTSFIENSCNALQEAMLVGCPCVATFTGGMPSLVHHRKTGLMVPPGCAHLVADAVCELFANDPLCERLGTAGHEQALQRNAPERVIAQLLEAYRGVTLE